MPSFTVRLGVREDVEAMVRMQMAMAWETEQLKLDEATLRRGMNAPFEKETGARYYVAEDTDAKRIVAMLMTTQEWSDWRAGAVLWIQSVFVEPDYRRCGLFRMLYTHLHDMVTRSDEYQGIRLYVETENKRAVETYKKMGMEIEHYHMMKWMKTDF